MGINVYEEDDRYPDYLLCFYDVDEKKYDDRYAPTWLASALLQIRWNSDKFPQFQWVAVVIHIRTEHPDASTFADPRTIGAVFSMLEVFHPDMELDQLVARTPLDRHPFAYDPKQPTPGEQQRWMMVERHARSHRASARN